MVINGDQWWSMVINGDYIMDIDINGKSSNLPFGVVKHGLNIPELQGF